MHRLKKVVHEYLSLEGNMFRYSLSYCFLLALFPTIILLFFLYQNQIIDFKYLLQFLYHYFPKDFLEPFIVYITNKNYPSLWSILITFFPSVYLASRSFYSFMLVSASHEKFQTHNFLLRIKAFVLFLLAIVWIVVISFFIHLSLFDGTITFMVGLFISLYMMYRILSFEKRPITYGMIGALFSTMGMVLTGMLFLQVVEIFTSYHNVYGPLGSLLTLFLSIYILSSIIYFGYCLNFEFGAKYEKKVYKNMWFYKLVNRMKEYLKKYYRSEEL